MSFSSRCDPLRRPRPIAGRRLRSALGLLPALLLAACVGPGGYSEQGAQNYRLHGESGSWAPHRYYPPPGPPEDPWGPYVREAAARYQVPGRWVRAVMHQESGGRQQAVSPVGAMGLMQVMPATYDGLRQRYGLGDDPFDPHNNILAGTAYIREMYDRFGAPGFLAAYNAGPDRVNLYLAGGSRLPGETVNYLAAVTPKLGDAAPLSGPWAKYASARPGGAAGRGPSAASLAAGCDLNAAYDPGRPCSSLMRAATAPAPIQEAFVEQAGPNGCDLSAAYDPGHPCTTAGQAAAAPAGQAVARQAAAGASVARVAVAAAPRQAFVQQAQAVGARPSTTAPPVSPATAAAAHPPAAPPQRSRPAASVEPDRAGEHQLALPAHDWGVQVGAFANPGLARAVAEGARAQAPDQLRAAAIALPPTPNGGSVLYRARLVNLSASAASNACWRLNQRQLPCVVVQPGRS